MTDTTIAVPNYVTMIPQDVRELASLTAALLAEAETHSLPVPSRIEIGAHDCDITLAGFGRHADGCKALVPWAEQFGGVLTGRDSGSTVVCEVAFLYQGARVTARAYIDPAT